MITMREAVAADAAAVRALTREAYTKWVAVTGREPLPMRVDYVEAVAKHRFDLLHEDGALVAQFDNLGKGASGAAVQNLNIALGLEETAGL